MTFDPYQTKLIKDTGGLQRLIGFITDIPAPDEDLKGDKAKKGGDKGSRTGKKGGKGDEGWYTLEIM